MEFEPSLVLPNVFFLSSCLSEAEQKLGKRMYLKTYCSSIQFSQLWKLGFLGASRPSSISMVNMFSLWHWKTKKKIFYHLLTFPGVTREPTKNLGPIGFDVYWIQTSRHPIRRTSEIYIYIYYIFIMY